MQFNVCLDRYGIKNALLARTFAGEATWKPNPSVAVGDLLPVLYLSTNDDKLIQTMKWGYDRFENGNLTSFARLETVSKKWHYSGHCVIPIKGFYFKQNELKHIIDFYVDAEQKNEVLYVAGIYFVVKKYNRTEYKVVVLTQSTDNDENLFAYLYRMPVFLEKNLITKWLTSPKFEQNILMKFAGQKKQKLQEPRAIAEYINQNIKDEKLILTPRHEWKAQKEADEIDWEKALTMYES